MKSIYRSKTSSDISEASPRLEEKLPPQMSKIFTPNESARIPMLPLGSKEDLLKKFNSLSMSPGVRRKNFQDQKRNLKVSSLGAIKKKEEQEDKSPRRGFKAFLISKNVKLAAKKFLNIVRRKSFFSDVANLNNFHYGLINDSAAVQVEKKEGKNNSMLKNWRGRGLILEFPEFKKRYSGLKMNTIKIVNFILTFYKRFIPAFDPNHALKLLWDFINVTLIVFQLIWYTFERGFIVGIKESQNFQIFGLFCMIFQYLDVFFTLNTFYFKEGVPIKDSYKILVNYIKGRFLADIVSCLALTMNFIQNHDNNFFDLNIFLVFKLFKYNEFEEKIKNMFITTAKKESLYKIIGLVTKVLLLAHLIACGWHYIAFLSSNNNPEINNWLRSKGIEREEWNLKYLYSIYWGVTTMLTVGYGDITPTNPNEMTFNICAMLSGCALFCYSMNYVGEILRIAGRREKLKKEQLEQISSMLRKKNLPHELQTRVRKYLEFIWEQEISENPEQENFMMSKLSSSLRDEVYLHTNVKYLKSVKVLSIFSERTLIRMASYMKRVRFSPEEFVYKKGEFEDQNLFFVIEGNLEVVSEMAQGKIRWNTLKKGDYFGLHEFITGFERLSGVISNDFSSLFHISRNDFISVLKSIPEEYEKFCKIKDDILLNKELKTMEISCPSCMMKDHRIEECKLIKYKPDELSIISKYCHEKKRYMKTFNRKLNSRHRKQALLQVFQLLNCQQEFLDVYKNDEDIKELKEMYDNSPKHETHDNNNFAGSPRNKVHHAEAQDPSITIPLSDLGTEGAPLSGESFKELGDRGGRHMTKKHSTIGKKIQKKSSFSIHPIPLSQNLETTTYKENLTGGANIHPPNNGLSRDELFRETNSFYNNQMSNSNQPMLNNLDFMLTPEAFLTYDHVRVFKYYFPHGNIENMVKKLNRRTRRHREKKYREIQSREGNGLIRLT